MAHFAMLPFPNRFESRSTHFSEHHPSRLPTSTTAANKRAEFAAARRQVAMDWSLSSPKTSVQHNNGHLTVPKSLERLPKINGFSSEHDATTFSTLPIVVVQEPK
jgi:hypothetical protein